MDRQSSADTNTPGWCASSTRYTPHVFEFGRFFRNLGRIPRLCPTTIPRNCKVRTTCGVQRGRETPSIACQKRKSTRFTSYGLTVLQTATPIPSKKGNRKCDYRHHSKDFPFARSTFFLKFMGESSKYISMSA